MWCSIHAHGILDSLVRCLYAISITVYPPSSLFFSDMNECIGDNATGPCHHYCTNTIGSYQCSCEVGYTLTAGGHACSEALCNAGCIRICMHMSRCLCTHLHLCSCSIMWCAQWRVWSLVFWGHFQSDKVQVPTWICSGSQWSILYQ